MDKGVLERLFSFSDNFQDNPDKASEDFYFVLVKVSELIFQGQYEEVAKIKRLLDDELISAEIGDRKSYNLGKAHALIELGNWLAKYNRLKLIKEELTQEELAVLSLIEEKKEVQLSDFTQILSLDKEVVIFLLSKFKKQDLIKELKVGQYTLYQLTLDGLTILN